MYFHVTGHIPDRSKVLPFVAEESRMSLLLQQEGSTLIAVRRIDAPGVFLVLEADSLQQAQANMARLPFVAQNVMTLDYVEVDRV